MAHHRMYVEPQYARTNFDPDMSRGTTEFAITLERRSAVDDSGRKDREGRTMAKVTDAAPVRHQGES
jgi:hypothetical protein